MTFYGKDPEPTVDPETKQFGYMTPGQENAEFVKAHHVFFYESGHVGFWNDKPDGGRTLVLATKADDVWEDDE